MARAARDNDPNYPSSMDLLNLCGLPLPAQNQAEEFQKLISPLVVKMDHLINVQVQTAKQLDELRNVILQMSCVKRTVEAILPRPETEDKQSVDDLLDDDEGRDMEQDEHVTQTPVLNADQVYGANYAAPHPPTDILNASVACLMNSEDMHEQEQGRQGQVPLDDIYEELENTMRN